VDVTTGKHDEELFPAVTANGIVAAGGGFHAVGGFAENHIAGQVAVGIIDVFEAVKIGHQEPDGLVFAGGSSQFDAQHVEDAAAIEKAGEAIVRSLFAECFAGQQEFLLEIQYAPAGAQAYAEFVGVEGLVR
jgi:hypothetical protein